MRNSNVGQATHNFVFLQEKPLKVLPQRDKKEMALAQR
jgi:hypothetical protein